MPTRLAIASYSPAAHCFSPRSLRLALIQSSARCCGLGAVTLGFLFATTGRAAESAATADAPAASGAPVPVKLSVFEVSADKDVGYQGGNTASGSRLNTSLKDTAASIMVVTPEFISDFGLNSIEEITSYAANLGVDMLENRSDPNPGFISGLGPDTRLTIRGLEASSAMDFFEATFPVDSYNVERLEVSSGPNSILFGFGNPGGLVNVMTKSAKTDRMRTGLRMQFGDWDHQRYEVDHNQVLRPGTLALRLNGVAQDSEGWRTNDFQELRRGAASVRFKPWARTTLVANGEAGRRRSHVHLPMNAEDGLSLWTASGSPTMDDAAWTTAARARGINRNAAVSNIYVTNADGSAPYFIPTRNAAGARLLVSTYEDLNVPAAERAGRTLVDPKVIPFEYSLYGPGAVRHENFGRVMVSLEQNLTDDIVLALGYDNENHRGRTEKPLNQQMVFSGDPNLTIPNPAGVGPAIRNPNAGRLFIEDLWNPFWGETDQQVFRGALSARFDLGRWGNHHLAGMYENGDRRTWYYQGRVIFVDDNNVPINTAAIPENAANFVRRRHYVIAGDFSTYQVADGRETITITRNGVRYHSRPIVQATSPNDVERNIQTGLIVTQSRFFDSKLVVTGGLRKDRIVYDQHGSARYVAADPEVQSGERLLGELHYTPEIAQTFVYEPTTYTVGGVYHLTPRLSVFYNTSTNNAQPRQNQNILPDETLPPPSDGKTHDYGFMLSFLEGKFFVRATAYETAQTLKTGAITFRGLVAPTTQILGALLANNRITAAQYEEHLLGDVANLVATFDEVNSGYEVSAWYNPGRHFTAQFNLAHTKTDRSRIAPEFEGWYEREHAFWYASPGAGALTDPETGSTIDENAAVHPRAVRELREFNNFGYGIRPFKASISGRYSFTREGLKGVFVGGGTRWQSKAKLGRRTLGTDAGGSVIYGETVHGPESFALDGFIGYRRKIALAGREREFTVQVNVRNITDESEFMPLRYNEKFSGYARVLLVEPRQIRATVSLNF